MEISMGQREYLIEMISYEYIIPDEFHGPVKEAIRKYATNSKYTDAVIDSMVKKPQSMAASIGLIRDNNLSLFRGKFAEWLACIEYNALKNKGNVVMTIINPDTTSKADLLHIVKKGNKYEAIAGPDVKSGGIKYNLDQWRKILMDRYEIPMVDMDGIFTTEEGLKKLTDYQKKEYERLLQMFPNKKPIKSIWNKQDINRLMVDYLKYVDANITPATSNDKPFKATKENRDRIKKMLFESRGKAIVQGDWNQFQQKSISLFDVPKDYMSATAVAKIKQKEESRKKKINTSSKSKVESNNKKGPVGKENNINNKNKQKGPLNKQPKAPRLVGEVAKGAASIFKKAAKKVPSFLINVGKKAGPIVAEVGLGMLIDKIVGRDTDTDLFDCVEDMEIKDVSDGIELITKTTHDSPIKHTVKGHGQHYNTREGRKWREKDPYTRGKAD